MHTLEDVVDPTPLEILTHKLRACTGRIAFNLLSIGLKKYLYDKVATFALNSGGVLSYIMAADSVAVKIRLRIEPCDRQTIKNSISNRVQAAKRLGDEVGEAPIVVVDVAMADINRSEGVTNKRKERCGRTKNGDGHLPSNKLQTYWHGCRGFIAYQNTCKTYASACAKHISSDSWYLHRASIDMEAELSKIGVTLSSHHCRRKIKEAIENGGIRVV